jgi:hypothetical protein
VVRTVARTNPTVLFLKNGTVDQKWGKQDWKKMAAYLNNIK